MMKTQIVLCCDKCEEFLQDQYECYGLYNEGDLFKDIYICHDCMDQIIDSVIKDMQCDYSIGAFFEMASHESGYDVYYLVGNYQIKLCNISAINNTNKSNSSAKYFLVTNNTGKKYLFVVDKFYNGYNPIAENKDFFADIIKSNFVYGQIASIRDKFDEQRERDLAYKRHLKSRNLEVTVK